MKADNILNLFDNSIRNIVLAYFDHSKKCEIFYSNCNLNIIIKYSNSSENYDQYFNFDEYPSLDIEFIIRENLKANTVSIGLTTTFETYSYLKNSEIETKFCYISDFDIFFSNNEFEIKSPLNLHFSDKKIKQSEIDFIISFIRKEHLRYLLDRYKDETD